MTIDAGRRPASKSPSQAGASGLLAAKGNDWVLKGGGVVVIGGREAG